MFMIVSYPWPVASAHVQLDGAALRAAGRRPQDQDQDQPAIEPDQQHPILLASKA